MERFLPTSLLLLSLTAGQAQTLVDSIPFPDLTQGFWGIHVTADTVFLGDDFSGNVYFFDHAGDFLGQQATGFDFNHGLVRRPDSYLIAQDYTTDGAHLYEVGLNGTLLNTWTFPDVIGGHSSGVGGICADGDAIWYTMYYPDFDVYPFAYAYKWVPGDAAPIDTVPMLGAQPLGIALKGDTLLYVMDDNDGDAERIYAYDLTNEQDLGHVDLPNMVNGGNQSPHGLYYDGSYLYLVANRTGSAAFAYQTVFIYSFDPAAFIREIDAQGTLAVHPTPATDVLQIDNTNNARTMATLLDLSGRTVVTTQLQAGRNTLDIHALRSGMYVLHTSDGRSARIVVQ